MNPPPESLRQGERRDAVPGPGHGSILEVRIDEIRVGERLRRDMGDLAALADSMRSGDGPFQPIGITPEYELVFGERRLRAGRDILGMKTIPARIVNVPSILDGQIDENELRKDYTVSERVAIVEALRSFGHGGDRRSDQARNGDVEGRTVDEAARRAGLGGKDGYFRAKRVIERGNIELVKAMDAGDISVSAAAELASLGSTQQEALLAEKTDWTVGEIADRREQTGAARVTPRQPDGLDAEARGFLGGQSDGGRTGGLPTPSVAGDGGRAAMSSQSAPSPSDGDMPVMGPPGEPAEEEEDLGGDERPDGGEAGDAGVEGPSAAQESVSAEDILTTLIKIGHRLKYLEAEAGRAEWKGVARDDFLGPIDEGIETYTRIRERIVSHAS